MANIELQVALRSNARNEALLAGRARSQGIDIRPVRLAAGEAAPAAAQVREIPFAHHLAALGAGDTSSVGIPVFSERGFPHASLVVSSSSGISAPDALAGKRIGVADLSGSESLFTKGALAHDLGLSLSALSFLGERKGGASGAGSLISRDSSLAAELASGGLDAAVGVAGTPLFSDPRAEARRYFASSGMYPMLSVVVVDAAVVERYPWVVLNLYSAFLDSKQQAISEAQGLLAPYLDAGVVDGATGRALAGDAFPYGVVAQRQQLETAAAWAAEQGLSSAALSLSAIFYPPSLEL